MHLEPIQGYRIEQLKKKKKKACWSKHLQIINTRSVLECGRHVIIRLLQMIQPLVVSIFYLIKLCIKLLVGGMGKVGSVAASVLLRLKFNPDLGCGVLYDFPHVQKGFLQDFISPPTSQEHARYSKLPLGVNMCVHGGLSWTDIIVESSQSREHSRNTLGIGSIPPE